ncbi:MAG: hypothetical protein AAGK01_02235 [Pseudomonadota bacterium]
MTTHAPLNRPLGAIADDERALRMIAALSAGGDARITLCPEMGLNKYLSAPHPREVLAYSSSTVSDISAEAFAHLLALDEAGEDATYREQLTALSGRILAAYGIGHDAALVFAPSGTDLEYIALAAVHGRGEEGVHNILLGADEIGSGCIHSAHGRYFARETALIDDVAPALDVPGFGAISLVDIPVRCERGMACTSAEISAAMAAEIAQAKVAGKHSLVHCVHGSKTGLVLPNRTDLMALMMQFSGDATFVVDACQARITSEAVAEYLDLGCIVLMTGSKFMGAPPFNGWALLPKTMVAGARALPSGFASIFRRAEFPETWDGRDQLPESGNPSLVLRLTAAVFELERFQQIAMIDIERMIEAFECALTRHVIEPLGASRVSPDKGAMAQDCPIEMRTLATLDVSGIAGLRTFEDAQRVHRVLALDGVRLGQPVKCVQLDEGWGGTLRIGLSMPQMSRWAGLDAGEMQAELASDMARIAAALQHSLTKMA